MSDSDDDKPVDDEALADEWAAALEEQGPEDGDVDPDAIMSAELENFEQQPAPSFESAPGSPNMEVILDIPVTLAMEVGSTAITIRNLLQLNQGSVIELDRLAGEPLDVLVNGTLIAHGEVVVVNEKALVRA